MGEDCALRLSDLPFPSLLCLQGVESENMNVVKRLFKIQNLNASTIRTVMVVDCSRYDSPDLLLNHGEGAAATPQSTGLGSKSEEEPPQQREEPAAGEALEAQGEEDALDSFLTDIVEGRIRPVMTEFEMETKVAQLLAKNRTKPPEPRLLSTEGSGSKKYLIFTTGCLTYSPHQIGKSAKGAYQKARSS